MTSRTARFDRVARIYPWLEWIAFGRNLQRARLAHVDRLRTCRNILLLGDGDGRALEAILRAAPDARIRSVDASATMLAIAAQRETVVAAAGRVQFEHADARDLAVEPACYDAVVTLFFLDCFAADDVRGLVGRFRPGLRDDGCWLFADFAIPAGGVARLRARLWVSMLYAFFRATTGIAARELPPSERLLGESGLRPVATTEFSRGLLRSVVFQEAGCPR